MYPKERLPATEDPNYKRYAANLFNYNLNPIPKEHLPQTQRATGRLGPDQPLTSKSLHFKNIQSYPELFSLPQTTMSRSERQFYSGHFDFSKNFDYKIKPPLNLTKTPMVLKTDVYNFRTEKYINENLLNFYVFYMRNKQKE